MKREAHLRPFVVACVCMCTTLIITGRIRPEDIKTDNTVDSDRVADSHIQYKPKGAVADANRRGWLHRLFDFVNVF